MFCDLTLASQSIRHFALGADFDAVEVVSPEALILLHPVMDRFQLLGVKAIQAKLSSLGHRNNSNFSEHAEVLRNGWLWNPERFDHLADSALVSVHQQVDNFASPRLGNCVEYVGGCRCSGHQLDYIPISEYVKGNKKDSAGSPFAAG